MIVRTHGTVNCVNVADESAFGFGFKVAFCEITEEQTSDFETFHISTYGSQPSASTLALHNIWLAMLREAMATGRKVHIGHEQFGGLIHHLEVDKSP